MTRVTSHLPGIALTVIAAVAVLLFLLVASRPDEPSARPNPPYFGPGGAATDVEVSRVPAAALDPVA